MSVEPEKYAGSAVEGFTRAVLEFIASRWWRMKLHHFPRTVKKYQKDGIYPARMTVRLNKTPILTTENSMIVKFQIHLTPFVCFHLGKFAIRKRGSSSGIGNVIFNGFDDLFPHIHLDERPLPMRDLNSPCDRSPILINENINRIYHLPEATFEIPYESTEGKIKVQVVAMTHDTKGESYDLLSELIEI